MRRMTVAITMLLVAVMSGPVFADKLEDFLSNRTLVAQLFFPIGESRLTDQHKHQLEQLKSRLVSFQAEGKLLRIEGFASPEGQRGQNYELSSARALSVTNFLEQMKLRTQIFLTGYGEKKQTADKLSEQRRVDIVIYETGKTAKQLFQESGKAERLVIQ